MKIIDTIKNWSKKRDQKKKASKDVKKEREEYLAKLKQNIEVTKKEIKDLQDQKSELAKVKEKGIDSTSLVEKRGRIKSQRIEIEIIDGERTSSHQANVIDGYWIEWKEGKEKIRKIIGTKPRVFEYKIFFFWRRGLKYYIKREADVTHEPDASAFVLPQAKFAMRLVAAVIKAETFVEIAKATKGRNNKELIIWLVALVLLGLGGIAGTGGYFK